MTTTKQNEGITTLYDELIPQGIDRLTFQAAAYPRPPWKTGRSGL